MSCFFPGKRATLGDGLSPGIENPTTEEVGSALALLFDVEDEPSVRNNDAHDFFTAGAEEVGAGAGADAMVGASCKAPESTLGEDMVGALGSVAETDPDVMEETDCSGTGVSGTVEDAGVVSIAEDDGISTFTGGMIEVFPPESAPASPSGTVFSTEGMGVIGGVGRSRASSITF